jgi:hypothetical protein
MVRPLSERTANGANAPGEPHQRVQSGMDSAFLYVLTVLLCSCGPTKTVEPAGQRADSGTPLETETETDSGTSPPVGPSAEFGPTRPCEAPLESVHWTEMGASSGLPVRPDDGRPTEEATYLVVDDFDQDGDLDLLTSVFGLSEVGFSEPVTLHTWEDDHFETRNLAVEALWQPTLGDVDGDGDRDVILAGSDVWLENDNGVLIEAPLVGIDAARWPFTRMFSPIDLNQDGHLDLYGATTHPGGDAEAMRDYIAWGQSDGRFDVDPDAHPSNDGGMAFSAQWLDWAGDGHPEIYVANDQGYAYGANKLWSWDDSTPQDRAPGLHADLTHDAMGVDSADWNGDGQPDLYLSANVANVLLVSQPDGTLADMTMVANANPMFGLSNPILMGWGGVFADHDNDGQPDLVVTLGDWWSEPGGSRPEMKLHLLQSNGVRFDDVGAEVGVDAQGSFRGVVARDFNQDGVLDFMVSTVFGAPLWFVSDGCTVDHWVEVQAPDSSHITITAGGTTQVGWASTSSGFGAAAIPVAHFGLGDNDTIDHVEVVLPGGTVWRTDAPLESRRRIIVRP